MCLEVRLVGEGVSLEAGRLHDELQDAAHVLVELFHRQTAALDCFLDVLGVLGAARLDEVVQGEHVGCAVGLAGTVDGVGAAEPVGHHHALVAPVAAEDVSDEVLALGGLTAVDAVVGRHHGPWAGLLDRYLEVLEVDFPGGADADAGVVPQTGCLLLVEGVVLDARAHSLALDAVDVCCGDVAGEDRVFGVVLEVAAAERVAVDADAGGEEDVCAIFADLIADGGAHGLHQVHVP